MPVLIRSVDSSDTCASGTGPSRGVVPAGTQRRRAWAPGARVALAALADGDSLAVFHSPHAGQCPNHRGCSLPQAVQKNEVRAALGDFADFPLIFMSGLERGRSGPGDGARG
jgi:hypothetical protein